MWVLKVIFFYLRRPYYEYFLENSDMVQKSTFKTPIDGTTGVSTF